MRPPRPTVCSWCRRSLNDLPTRLVTKAKMNPPNLCSLKFAGLTCGLAFVLATLNSGCISTDETVYRDEDRMKVEFENDTAGRLFYEALSQTRGAGSRRESKTEVSIPVVFSHKHRVADGENIAFNQGVRRCDTNGDGKITELEARIFSESVSKYP